MKKQRFKNHGSALLLAIVAIVLLLVMGSTLLSMGLNSRIFSLRTATDITARCAADAGLTRALYEMNEKLKVIPWDGTSLPLGKEMTLTDCDATYSYIVTGDLAGGYNITSIGNSGNATRVVQATLGLKGIFDHAILTKDTLILKSDTLIDGYNSKKPSKKDIKVDIGSQSTSDSSVILNNNSTVKGDVVVGIGGDPDTAIKDLGATVQGNKRAATTRDPLPEINPPTTLVDKGTSITAKGTTVTLTPDQSGTYTAIDLQKGKEDTILEVSEGDVVLYITGDIELDQGAEIIVKDGATLTLYIDGDILCREGSGINTEAPPEEAATLKLFATGEGEQVFDVKAKSEWTGVIYAPDADVLLYANGDAYGSIVADTFEYKAGGNFHYDEALREAKIEDQGVTFGVTRWSESKVTASAMDIIEAKEQLLNVKN